jgi:hypothetical protein
MRVFLILLLLVPLILIRVESQEPANAPPDLEVGEYSTSKFRTYDPIYRTKQNSNKADTRSRQLVYQDEIRNRNSIENRSRDMLDLEESVMREAALSKPIDLFRYRVNLKNTGIKVVKFVIWDYQTSLSDDFADTSHRLFRCTAKIKPNQSERFDGLSIQPPLRVVSASASGKTSNQRVIINRIDYTDGTFWQRPEWREPEVAFESGRGNCQPL